MLTYSTLVWETISKWIPNNTNSSVLTPYYLPESFGRSWELSGCRKRSHMTGKNCSNNQHSHGKEMVLNSKNNLVCLLKQILRPQSYKFQFSFLVGGGLKQLHFQQAHQKLGCRSVLHSQCRHAGTVVWDHFEQCRKFSIPGPHPSNASRASQLLWQLLYISKYPLGMQYHLKCDSIQRHKG